MSKRPAGLDEALTEFGAKLELSLSQGQFVRVVLSQVSPQEGEPHKILGRLVELRGQPALSLTLRWPTRDEVRNVSLAEAVKWVMERVRSGHVNALLCTTRNDWQLSRAPGRRCRLICHKPSQALAPSRAHDRTKASLLDDSARDWLEALGLTDRAGRVRPGMAHKHAQINQYLEIVSHLMADCGWTSGTTADGVIADMGSGKGYLTFALWQLCRRQRALPVGVLGVDARNELVELTNGLARRIGAEGLRFVPGAIESVELPRLRALIALHACDTATDAAILRGIDLGAQLIVVAPCCHKQVRPQLAHPIPLAPVLHHGLLAERIAEWTTDALRTLFLEWAGFRTKVIEFVSTDHTPKNVMIAGIKERPGFCDVEAHKKIAALKAFFGIERHALDPLLARTAAPPLSNGFGAT